jgi:hypothetical protein
MREEIRYAVRPPDLQALNPDIESTQGVDPDRYATKEVPWPSVVPALLGSIATSTTIPAPDQGDRRRAAAGTHLP